MDLCNVTFGPNTAQRDVQYDWDGQKKIGSS